VRAQRAVLLTIADAANRDGEHSHPGVTAMIEGSLYSRSRVLAVLRELIVEGWVEIEEEGRGRGHATVYRIPGVADGGPRKGPVAGPIPDEKGPETDAERSNLDPEKVQSSAIAPLSSTVTTKTLNTSPPGDDVTRLCEQLAEKVANQQDGRRPPITDRWRTDMRLLLERGPLHQDTPEPVGAEKVGATIDYVFERLAEPQGRGGFCWAAQVRSPAALRDHWYQMADAARRLRAGQRGPTATAIDRAVARLRPETPDLFTQTPTPAGSSWAARALGAGQ
jgi:hypothetical protein